VEVENEFDKSEQSTDTHMNSDGIGHFNYRMIFPVKIDEYTNPEQFKF